MTAPLTDAERLLLNWSSDADAMVAECAVAIVTELLNARARLAALDAAVATLAAERVVYEHDTGNPFDAHMRLNDAIGLFLRAAGVDVEALLYGPGAL